MSESPRLLFCTYDVIPAPTGSSRRMTEYLKGLADRFNVVVLSAKTPDVSHIEKYQGARLLRVPVGTGDLASRLQAFDRAVRRQLESEDYALVHFTEPFGGYALCEQRDSYGYRLVYEAMGFPSQELRYTHPQTEGDRRFISRLKRQELYCLMNAERIVTGSSVTASMIHGLGVPEEHIHVIPAPADLAAYRGDALGEPDGVPMKVLYLGSQVGWQGLPTLLHGIAHALKRADLKLVLVGPKHPDWQPHLQDAIEELKVAGKVEFQDPVGHDDLPKILATCDACVMPLEDNERNRLQGGPCAKVSEAMAAGRPVIAADLPVARRAIPEGTGLFFPPGDGAALGERLLELASNPKRRVELGKRARAYAEERLDAARVRGLLIDLYDGLLGSARRPAVTEESAPDRETAVAAMPSPPKGHGDTDPAVPRPYTPEPVVLGQLLPPETKEMRVPTQPDTRAREEVIMGTPLMTEPELPKSEPPGGGSLDEPDEISNEHIQEAPDTSLDPWLAQVVHGYCPPEAAPFARPTPPSHLPGREEPARGGARPNGSRPRMGRTEDSSPGFKP